MLFFCIKIFGGKGMKQNKSRGLFFFFSGELILGIVSFAMSNDPLTVLLCPVRPGLSDLSDVLSF